MKRLFFLFLATCLAIPAVQASTSDGQIIMVNNADCIPALPHYEGTVRKRPLATANEGVAGGFVTCSFRVDENASLDNNYGGVEWFSVTARNINNGGANINVSCTAVVGVDNGQASYYPKNVTLTPVITDRKVMTWNSTDYGLSANGFQGPIALSCFLPVGGTLNEMKVHWDFADRT